MRLLLSNLDPQRRRHVQVRPHSLEQLELAERPCEFSVEMGFRPLEFLLYFRSRQDGPFLQLHPPRVIPRKLRLKIPELLVSVP